MFRVLLFNFLLSFFLGVTCSLIQPYMASLARQDYALEKSNDEKESDSEDECDDKNQTIEEVILLVHNTLTYITSAKTQATTFNYLDEKGTHQPNVPYPPPDPLCFTS
jgi:hypothetical protein